MQLDFQVEKFETEVYLTFWTISSDSTAFLDIQRVMTLLSPGGLRTRIPINWTLK